jgi:hypothetical protein
VDPEGAGSIVCRGHDASSVRVAAHDERLLAQLRILELLDCGEERVEVDVSENRHACKARGLTGD